VLGRIDTPVRVFLVDPHLIHIFCLEVQVRQSCWEEKNIETDTQFSFIKVVVVFLVKRNALMRMMMTSCLLTSAIVILFHLRQRNF